MQARMAAALAVAVLAAGLAPATLAQPTPPPPVETPTTMPTPPPPVPPEESPIRRAELEAAAAPPVPPAAAPSTAPRVALDIACGSETWGQIVIELDEDRAPFTVRNFLTFVDQGFYNGTIFHRIISDYVAQGGGYFGPDQPKKVNGREPVRNESDNLLKNLKYSVAMARGRNPRSATSQFFINLADNPKLDYPGHDGAGYCVFGLVTGGREVVDRIAACPVGPNPKVPGEDSRPTNPPLIRRAYRLPPEPPPPHE